MKKFGMLFFLVIVIGAGIFLLNNGTKTSSSDSVVPSPTEEKLEPTPSIDVSDLRMGGNSYREENGLYGFLYPSDFVLDENDKQHIRIYKTGKTQKGQTEMYDGALLVFEVVSLDGKSLSDWVDSRLASITAEGTSEVTEPKKKAVLTTYPGFSYSTRGLGESKNYIFQKDTNSPNAVLISTLVSDPGNVGFQKDVDKTISTLEIFK